MILQQRAMYGVHLRQYFVFFQSYLGFQRLRVLWMSVLILGDILLQLAGPQFLGNFVDAIQQRQTLQTLLLLAVCFLVTAIVARILAGLASYMSEMVGWHAVNKLRANLLAHCLHLDRTFHLAHTPGALIERIDGDVEVLGDFFSQFVTRVAGNGLLLIGILILIARVNLVIGAIFALYLGFSLGVVILLQTKIIVAYKHTRQAAAEMTGLLGEHIASREDIVANGAIAYAFRHFFVRQRRFNAASLKSSFYSGLFGGLWQLLDALSVVIVLVAGIILLTQHRITIGTVFLLFSYANLLVYSTNTVTEQFTRLQQSAASLERINELAQTTSQIIDGPGVVWPRGPLSITFSHVSFVYPTTQQGLHDISFHLQPGEILGLLGHTGSGKTTLTRLLLRFYDPAEGEILFDTTDICQAKVEALRRCVGLVTQDIHIFHASVRDNIALFDPTCTDEQIMMAISQLGLEEWFAKLFHGLETPLTPTSLSAGEAQLLAFLRIFLCDPQIILFDEASSRLDYATEQLILQAMKRLLENRTGIIIAHRLSTLAHVDRIMILEQGHIIEEDVRLTLEHNPTSRFSQMLKSAKRKEEYLST